MPSLISTEDHTRSKEMGERLKAARQRKGLSRKRLSVRIGRHLSTIRNAEAGSAIPSYDLPKYCNALDISADELLGIEAQDSWSEGHSAGYKAGLSEAIDAITHAVKELAKTNGSA